MRRSYFRLLEGVLLSLPLLFASCGNGDNALEEIINGGGSEGGGSSAINATAIKLDQTALRFDKNVLTAQTLTATVSPAEATDKTVTWKSSDETVATVDANGQVTPKAKGTATITATANDGSGMKATSTVYVYDKIVDISTDISVDAGESWLINGNGTEVAYGITIDVGATVTLNGVNITNQIECLGNATIILADGSTNTVDASGINDNAAIKVGGAGKTLTINAETEGTGTLTAKGGSYGAGIGTNKNETGGNIVINGGRVTATGGTGAAGIGTGLADGSANECGTIRINGGRVTATGGGVAAAGIGTGYAYGSTNTCGAITINGGTVNATGGTNAAGIGTGEAYHIQNTCSAITINGGTVNATGGDDAAGIGTGIAIYSTNECGAITIKANVTSVTATKGTSSPNSIGKGYNDEGTQTCGTITFGTAEVFSGTAWSPSDPLTAGTYGGLKLVISKTNVNDDTWTLTPAP